MRNPGGPSQVSGLGAFRDCATPEMLTPAGIMRSRSGASFGIPTSLSGEGHGADTVAVANVSPVRAHPSTPMGSVIPMKRSKKRWKPASAAAAETMTRHHVAPENAR